MKKVISVLIPCYNEVENVGPISEAVIKEFEAKLPQYDYEIVFIDNFSTDGTRDVLEKICSLNKNIKANQNATQNNVFLNLSIAFTISFISPPYAPAFILIAPPIVPGIPAANSNPVISLHHLCH